ncbi:MAG: helix-turn-helix domain-containing protein [Gammaproteobacteria bacterium]
MANKLDLEARMTIKALAERGQSNRAIARLLGVHENAVRYHRRRLASDATDGRARQTHLAADFDERDRRASTPHARAHPDRPGPLRRPQYRAGHRADAALAEVAR